MTIEADFDDWSISIYRIDVIFGSQKRKISTNSESNTVKDSSRTELGPIENITWVRYQQDHPGWSAQHSDILLQVPELLNGVHYYRLDPSFLALPVAPDS